MPVGELVVFISLVGLVVAVGIVVGMITASRLDRISNPDRKPRDPDAEPPATEEPQP
jgi:hypothetical protein